MEITTDSPLETISKILVENPAKDSLNEEFEILYDYVSSSSRFSNECSFLENLSGLKSLLEDHSREYGSNPNQYRILALERFCRDQDMSLIWYSLPNKTEHFVSGINMKIPKETLNPGERIRLLR